VAPANGETRGKEEEKTRQSKVHQMEAVGPAGSASIATSASQEEQQHRYHLHSICYCLFNN
jgi:hypothetical protein